MVQVPPVPRGPVIDMSTGKLTSAGVDFFERLQDRAGGSGDRGLVNISQVTVNQSDLASAGEKRLLRARQTEQWRVHFLTLSGSGTSFSGGGGNRNLAIKSGSTIWSVIPAATLQALTFALWGDVGLPEPATPAHKITPTAKGADIVAAYSGGTTDYTAGVLVLNLWIERAA